jgi:deoxycytidylate deaminase
MPPRNIIARENGMNFAGASMRTECHLQLTMGSESVATLYCTNHPCVICSKMVMNAGIDRIIYEQGYGDDLAAVMLAESGIEVERFDRREEGQGRKRKVESQKKSRRRERSDSK